MARYDLGALVLAIAVLPLVMTPSSFVVLLTFSIRLLQFFGIGWCDSLCWNDLPGNHTKLHQCPSSVNHHDHLLLCTGDSARLLEQQLNGCWRLRHRRASKTPSHLSPFRQYLHTDVRTLFCFLMSAASPSMENSCDSKAGSYKLGGATLSFEGDIWSDKVLTAKIRSDGNGHMLWTKLEMEQIFLGAPPSFREKIRLCGDRIFCPDLRLVGFENRRRGGWVFAAGLLCDDQQELLSPVYVSNARVDSDTLLGGCKYAHDVVSSRIIPAFRNHTGLDDNLLRLLDVAASALSDMCSHSSGNSAEAFLHGTPLSTCFAPHEICRTSDAGGVCIMFDDLQRERAARTGRGGFLAEEDVASAGHHHNWGLYYISALEQLLHTAIG
jgi:hypothetical protein